MKTTGVREKPPAQSRDLADEYQFDYGQAKPNRFATKASANPLVVVLDDEIASVFPDAESVTSVLRALVRAMPTRATSSRARGVAKAPS